jgi:hypothetical protein
MENYKKELDAIYNKSVSNYEKNKSTGNPMISLGKNSQLLSETMDSFTKEFVAISNNALKDNKDLSVDEIKLYYNELLLKLKDLLKG